MVQPGFQVYTKVVQCSHLLRLPNLYELVVHNTQKFV